MLSLAELDRINKILRPTEPSRMTEYAMGQAQLAVECFDKIEMGEAVKVVEAEYWQKMEELQGKLCDMQGSAEWYALTEGDIIRLWVPGVDPTPFFFRNYDDERYIKNQFVVPKMGGDFIYRERSTSVVRHYDKNQDLDEGVTPEHQPTYEQLETTGVRSSKNYLRDQVDQAGISDPGEQDYIFNNGLLVGYIHEDETDLMPQVKLFVLDDAGKMHNELDHCYVHQSMLVRVPDDDPFYPVEEVKGLVSTVNGVEL